MPEKVSSVIAIKRYFETDGGRNVTLQEIKDLPPEDRDELGPLAAKELGLELKKKTT